VRDAVALMKDNGVGAVVALEEGVVVGILTERDILRALGEMVEGVLKQPVSELMTRDPVSLREDDAIAYVAHNMQLGGYRHVPIVDDDGRPVSIVSIKDVVRYVLSYFPEEVLNTVPEPYRGEPKVHGG
jgi:CBS domain-containing protein